MLYLDSSVLLADYLEQPAASWARTVWSRNEELVSSFLLLAEVPVVLRRAMASKSRTMAKALAARLDRFDQDARRLSILMDAAAVTALVGSDARFAAARTLDALHAAAAWHFQESSGTAVVVLTTDARLGSACKALGLKVEFPGH